MSDFTSVNDKLAAMSEIAHTPNEINFYCSSMGSHNVYYSHLDREEPTPLDYDFSDLEMRFLCGGLMINDHLEMYMLRGQAKNETIFNSYLMYDEIIRGAINKAFMRRSMLHLDARIQDWNEELHVPYPAISTLMTTTTLMKE
jgi:hypothetical protein